MEIQKNQREELCLALYKATQGCEIQSGDAWPCGTCFFAISDELTNADWQLVLLIRGDYNEKDLSNLPADPAESYNKMLRCCNGK